MTPDDNNLIGATDGNLLEVRSLREQVYEYLRGEIHWSFKVHEQYIREFYAQGNREIQLQLDRGGDGSTPERKNRAL